MNALTPDTRRKLQIIADQSDRDLGVNATTNGQHQDPRHYTGNGADIGFLNGNDIGTGSHTNAGMGAEAAHVQGTIADLSGALNVHSNLGPAGSYTGTNGPHPIQNAHLRDEHANHIHVTFNNGFGHLGLIAGTNEAVWDALSPQ